MFFGSFAWSFVYVSLPFHIQAISTADATATLRWTGWILGISSLVTVASSPLWGRWAGAGDPRAFYVVVEVLQGIGFLGMAAARTLPELFLARLVLGFVGATSTFAFIMAGRAAEAGGIRRRVAAIQSAMTVGQVVGPLAGAIAAARIGFRQSFVLGGTILWGCAALVWWGVPSEPAGSGAREEERPAGLRDIAGVALIVLAGSTQVFFLASILPQVLPELGVDQTRTLEVGGLLIFASGAAAALGSLATPRLGELLPERRLVLLLITASSVCLALLGAAHSVWPYGVLRFLQVLCIAPVFPLVVSRIAQHAGGAAIGVVNSARIGAAFVGPVVATSMLALTSSFALYLLLAAGGLACLPLVASARPGGGRR